MNNADYSELVDSLYLKIEELMDELIDQDKPLDYENSGGILTIDCEDTETKVIISRQQAVSQIWVAAKSGGFHLDYEETLWRCSTTQETLSELLSRVLTEQSDEAITITLD